jgi:hypothetical protein
MAQRFGKFCESDVLPLHLIGTVVGCLRVWIMVRPSTAGHTHVARQSRPLMASIDDEVVTLWLT